GKVYPCTSLYAAPEVRFESLTRAPHAAPPSVLFAYQVLNSPVELSCHATRKSPAVGPAAICGTLLSPRPFTTSGLLQCFPSSEVCTSRDCGPFAGPPHLQAESMWPVEPIAIHQ